MPIYSFVGSDDDVTGGTHIDQGMEFTFSGNNLLTWGIDEGHLYGDGQWAWKMVPTVLNGTAEFTIDIADGGQGLSMLSNLAVSISTVYRWSAGDTLKVQFKNTVDNVTYTVTPALPIGQTAVSVVDGNYVKVLGIAGQAYNQIVFTLADTGSTVNQDIPNISFHGISGDPACFARGTHIATPDGLREVQELQIGDMVTTADGAACPVLWLGVQTLTPKLGVPERMRPVRIAAGALGDGLPVRDLVLTGDHALLVDGALVNASVLVNGSTITYEPLATLGESFQVFHIETEAHTVVLAEGAPAETFVDATGRAMFDNHREYTQTYGAERIIPEMDIPRISARRMLKAVQDIAAA